MRNEGIPPSALPNNPLKPDSFCASHGFFGKRCIWLFLLGSLIYGNGVALGAESSPTLSRTRFPENLAVIVTSIELRFYLSSQHLIEQSFRGNNVLESGEGNVLRLPRPQIGRFNRKRMQNLVIDNQLEIARDVLSFGAATILNSQFEPARVLKSSGVMAVNFGAVEKDLGFFGKFQHALSGGGVLGSGGGELLKADLVLSHDRFLLEKQDRLYSQNEKLQKPNDNKSACVIGT